MQYLLTNRPESMENRNCQIQENLIFMISQYLPAQIKIFFYTNNLSIAYQIFQSPHHINGKLSEVMNSFSQVETMI